jgi:outer membrane protein OmpA-like peptidoglycan-associated protein
MKSLTRSQGTVLVTALLSVAALALALTTAAVPAGASLVPAAAPPSVPILGQVALKNGAESGFSAGVATLHGVRRIPGGTVIYFSVGYPASTNEDKDPSLVSAESLSPAYSRSRPITLFARNMLVDTFGKKVYTGLVPAGDTSPGEIPDCICSEDEGVIGYAVGQASVIYQVVAPLPESTEFVDVVLSGQVIGNVKVDSGPMTPEVDPSELILVGMGWPKVDQAVVASSFEPEKSVLDLTTGVADLEQTVTTRATPKQISVALASDVLFATDQATLSPKAKAVLLRAAAEVKAAGGSGVLQVVGYTDDTGSATHNVDLSRRRSAAVAAAMKTLLPGVRLPVSGKGETDPVAPNDTAGGRSLNRRVSLIFAPQGGAK